MSAVAYICTLYTQNKIALISMIVDDCSAYKRQRNIEGEISPLYFARRVCSFQSSIRELDKFDPKKSNLKTHHGNTLVVSAY